MKTMLLDKNTVRIRVMRFWGMLFCVLLPAAGSFAAADDWKLLRECEGGKLYQAGSQRVLLLWGSNYQMGKAHGTLLAKDVRALVDRVLKLSVIASTVAKSKTGGSLREMYQQTYRFIPKRYQEEMKGLAEGAGVPLHQVQLANLFPEMFHCSGFAMFGRATKDGRLLHGRVLDYMSYLGIQDFATTIVQRPDDGHAFVNVGYAGFVGCVTGMNEKQIALGELGGRGAATWKGMPMSFLMRSVLETTDTLEKAVNHFQKTPRTCEYYYVVSDGKLPDARGLHCTPELCEILKPGQPDKRIPEVFEDVITFSGGGTRFNTLVARIREGYGTFTPDSAIRLMDRPVAMKSNLHNVLFAPRTLELWAAHAGNPTEAKFQACYQPYRHYRLEEMLKRMPAPKPRENTGVVPAASHREMRVESDPAVAKKLKRFDFPAQEFSWRMIPRAGEKTAYNVQFPSPWTSPYAENNTVHCEYYPSRIPGRRPAIIMLHPLLQNFTGVRMICRYLAARGLNILFVKMPFYGERRGKNSPNSTGRLDLLLAMITQGVMDIRRSAAWLGERPEVARDRIGMCGVSLGGFITALTAGVDGQFPRVAVVLAGGDLPKLIQYPSRESAPLRNYIQKQNLSDDELRAILDPIEPLGYTPRIRRNTQVLMINATHDQVVPRSCTTKFAQATKARIFWYNANHYTLVQYAPLALRQVEQYFLADDWTGNVKNQLLLPWEKKEPQSAPAK